jgi:FMN-dependent NADH-azoreductase
MNTLLYLQASPREGRSHSRFVADALVEQYRQTHPGDGVTTLDVFKAALPPFDGCAVQAKYAILHGQKHSAEEAAAWRAVETLIADFKGADKYVFAVPMWNFGIPYRLKQYFDLIVQPGYTFSFTPEEGYKGLVTGKPAVIVSARGGEYGDGPESAGYDFQKRYVEHLLRFIGFTSIRTILVEPTLMGGPDGAEQARAAALERARAIAAEL